MLTPLPHPYGLIVTVALFAAIVVFAGIGGAMIASAWRGRLLGWAPTCAKCRFDLRASANELPERCPECGNTLAGAIDVGPRRTRRRRMIVGALLLMVSTVFAISGPTGTFRSINGWLLSKRSIESLAPALDARDSRAWRLALDRVRIGSPTEAEVDFLLSRLLAQMLAAKSVSGSDRLALMTLAQSTAAPSDLTQRVLDALESIGTVRVMSVTDSIAPNTSFAITASVADWPTLPGLSIRVRIVDVFDATGQPLGGVLPSAVTDTMRLPRAMINTRLMRAPSAPGEHALRVEVELRAVTDDESLVWEGRVESAVPIRVEVPDPAAPPKPLEQPRK